MCKKSMTFIYKICLLSFVYNVPFFVIIIQKYKASRNFNHITVNKQALRIVLNIQYQGCQNILLLNRAINSRISAKFH